MRGLWIVKPEHLVWGGTQAPSAGTKVGAGRWPYSGSHPDCWERPVLGVVLDKRSTSAWRNTVAFGKVVTKSEVNAHVDQCEARGLLLGVVPVAWTFNGKKCIHWERLSSLRSPAQDLAEWLEAHNRARRHLLVQQERLAA